MVLICLTKFNYMKNILKESKATKNKNYIQQYKVNLKTTEQTRNETQSYAKNKHQIVKRN